MAIDGKKQGPLSSYFASFARHCAQQTLDGGAPWHRTPSFTNKWWPTKTKNTLQTMLIRVPPLLLCERQERKTLLCISSSLQSACSTYTERASQLTSFLSLQGWHYLFLPPEQSHCLKSCYIQYCDILSLTHAKAQLGSSLPCSSVPPFK